MSVNYASQFQEALDQPFKARLKFEALYNTSRTSTNRFRYLRGKTIEISTLTVTGMTDRDRDNIEWAERRHSNEWTAYTLSHDRNWDTNIDPQDIDETNMVLSIANISRVFVTEQLIPELDKYMASKLYADLDDAGATFNTDAITDGDSALEVFDKLMENLDEAEVPDEGRIAYVTPEIHRFLKEALNASRSLGRTTSITDINRVISRLDEVELVKVPSARMKTDYDFTEGAVEGVGAETMRMIVLHPEAIIAPYKVEEVLTDSPTASSGGRYVHHQRHYWDVFVLAEKVDAIQINKTTT